MKKISCTVALLACLLICYFLLRKPAEIKVETVTQKVLLPKVQKITKREEIKQEAPPLHEEYSFNDVKSVAQSGEDGKREAWERAASAPIDFWGKVVDEKGDPIAGAHILFRISDNPDPYDSKRPEFETESDNNGLFSLMGKKGGILSVSVRKEGYYLFKKPTDGNYLYFFRGKPGYNALPTPERPVLYILKKKGEGAALIRIQNRSYPINGNGMPVEVNLESGKAVAANQGDLKIEYWALSAKNEKKHFDWKCRISANGGGGLAPWKGEQEFDFEAPESGYQPSIEIDMPASMERWNTDQSRKLFVKTSDGKYARIEFGMIAADEPFFVIEGYYNPSGSRNLEYDEAKQINK